MSPVAAFTVATPALSVVHVPPISPVLVNVVVPVTQIACGPDKTPALGAKVTVVVLVAVASEQPPVPVTVYVIVEVPADTPVITPEPATTVAKAGDPDVHVPPASPFEVNVVVPVEHIACVPDNTPALGNAVTVTVLVAVASAQPPVPVTV